MYEVYLITNTVNGKLYVGITKRGYLHRFVEHKSQASSGSRNILHCAMRKYGFDKFTVRLIESNVDDNIIGDRERYYIELYNTYYKNRKGYNMTIGGGGTIGYIFTKSVRKKMSVANTGRKYSADRNERIRKAMIGRDYKPEWRKALSESRIGRFGGCNNSFYGKKHTDATKHMIGDKNSKYYIFRCDKETLDVLQTYDSAMSAARWVVENGLGKTASTCNARILLVCRNTENMSAYGFKWKLERKCID